jgi:hypothetical protein
MSTVDSSAAVVEVEATVVVVAAVEVGARVVTTIVSAVQAAMATARMMTPALFTTTSYAEGSRWSRSPSVARLVRLCL